MAYFRYIKAILQLFITMSASFWILTKYYQLENQLQDSLQSYELAHSVDAIYKFLWDYYADWYVEYLKTDQSQLPFAREIFRQFVITCSPYCPFETEVLWKDFFGEHSLLATEVKDFSWTKTTFEAEFGLLELTDL